MIEIICLCCVDYVHMQELDCVDYIQTYITWCVWSCDCNIPLNLPISASFCCISSLIRVSLASRSARTEANNMSLVEMSDYREKGRTQLHYTGWVSLITGSVTGSMGQFNGSTCRV